jgi:hypothetical protein
VSINTRKIYGWKGIRVLGYKKTKTIDGVVKE